MSSFYLKILASNKVFFSGKADILVVPGLDGEIAIMAHHQNMAIATTIGDVRFKPEGSDEYIDAVVGIGFVYIANNRVTMIVDTAERPEDIDEVRAKAAMERAQEQANLYGHPLQREVAFLTVHSMLHLLGYDHENGGLEAMRMREKEEAVLLQLGLPRTVSYTE